MGTVADISHYEDRQYPECEVLTVNSSSGRGVNVVNLGVGHGVYANAATGTGVERDYR